MVQGDQPVMGSHGGSWGAVPVQNFERAGGSANAASMGRSSEALSVEDFERLAARIRPSWEIGLDVAAAESTQQQLMPAAVSVAPEVSRSSPPAVLPLPAVEMEPVPVAAPSPPEVPAVMQPAASIVWDPDALAAPWEDTRRFERPSRRHRRSSGNRFKVVLLGLTGFVLAVGVLAFVFMSVSGKGSGGPVVRSVAPAAGSSSPSSRSVVVPAPVATASDPAPTTPAMAVSAGASAPPPSASPGRQATVVRAAPARRSVRSAGNSHRATRRAVPRGVGFVTDSPY